VRVRPSSNTGSRSSERELQGRPQFRFDRRFLMRIVNLSLPTERGGEHSKRMEWRPETARATFRALGGGWVGNTRQFPL